MEHLNFDADSLLSQVKKLPRESNLAFAASCCERLLPNYEKFFKTEQWGDYSVLRNALDTIWQQVSGKESSKDTIQALLMKSLEVTPDSEDFSTIHVSFAIDAGGAINETLKYCLDEQPQHIIIAASFARDTVDMYIQEKDNLDYEDPNFELKIITHPLMVQELQKQRADIHFLLDTSPLNSESITRFRLSCPTKSNIEL